MSLLRHSFASINGTTIHQRRPLRYHSCSSLYYLLSPQRHEQTSHRHRRAAIRPSVRVAQQQQQQQQQQRRLFWNETLVDNKGSIARDILATERTFLAWARTGLAFVGAGTAMFATAYHPHDPHDDNDDNTDNIDVNVRRREIAAPSFVLVANGAFLLVFATRRYVRVLKALLEKDQFPIDIPGTLAAIMVTAVGTISSLGLVAKAEMDSRQRQHKKQQKQCDTHETKDATLEYKP
jgi:uncharacterized membrane protein YidH (DUF202 family)